MRYHYIPRKIVKATYGELYFCDHPVFSRATLYKIKEKGLCVIQQRYEISSKSTKWTEIDVGLQDDIYLNARFLSYFNRHADLPKNDIYPTVSLRQIMWALRMKPLRKEPWETVFDRKFI